MRITESRQKAQINNQIPTSETNIAEAKAKNAPHFREVRFAAFAKIDKESSLSMAFLVYALQLHNLIYRVSGIFGKPNEFTKPLLSHTFTGEFLNWQTALRLWVLLNFFYYIFHICYCLAERFIIILENILIVFESSVSVGILLSPLILINYLLLDFVLYVSFPIRTDNINMFMFTLSQLFFLAFHTFFIVLINKAHGIMNNTTKTNQIKKFSKS